MTVITATSAKADVERRGVAYLDRAQED